MVTMLLLCMLVLGACGGNGSDATSDEATDAGTGGDPGTCASFEGSGQLTVGSTNFAEQEIVAEMYAQCMEAAGFSVERKLKIGARDIVFPALVKGDIDLYPEYVGTLLTFLEGNPTSDIDKTVADLRAALEPRNLELLEPAEAEDKNGFAVTKATATKHNLKTLSDLQKVAPQLVFGAGPECDQRPLCLPGLKSTYGLTFKEVKKLDSGGPLTKDALEKGEIDVGLVFTSDGAVAARGFVVLEDDKKLQPPENLVPIVRADALQGDLEELLNSISAKLTTEELSELNKAVDIEKADPADAARGWLEENGFLKKG
ncbi:MAG: ABC transporter substrate-binding protein [Actinobacteria bacterium]|nr:ABC transporter substrate-binding protein [Actinomycetota bacterium]